MMHRGELDRAIAEISGKCIECNICVKQCAFLKKYGTPKSIAESWEEQRNTSGNMPYACSLCSLCTAVCPVDIDPRNMFLEMRRFAVDRKEADFTRQKSLLAYEKRGTSRVFSFYGLPQGCNTALFPGCALAGSRSQRVIQLYKKLQETIPDIGIVLDCCTKPSHDLGRRDFFNAMFFEMHDYLADHGIENMVTACPSCHAVFSKYASRIGVRSVYEILSEQSWHPDENIPPVPVTIQDSCVARFDENMLNAVRKLIKARGVSVKEMKHHGEKTLCCGEGAGAYFVAPDLARQWGEMRRKEMEGRQIITYCAGCANFLGRIGSTVHLLDLVFDPAPALMGNARVTKSPITYLKRLLLKNWFRKRKNYATVRERSFFYRGNP